MGLSRFIFFGTFVLLLGTMVSMSVRVLTVDALIPSVVSVVSYAVGSVPWLNITINHTPPPSLGSGHYVSLVQVEVNGTVQDLGQTPQSTETFSVQYSLGSNTDSYSVRARAYCNLHGFSPWSSLSMVPEYSSSCCSVHSFSHPCYCVCQEDLRSTSQSHGSLRGELCLDWRWNSLMQNWWRTSVSSLLFERG